VSDLVKRLRQHDQREREPWDTLCGEAADYIEFVDRVRVKEAQVYARNVAEIERLTRELREARSHILADEERTKLTGDALHAEGELAALRESNARLTEEMAQASAALDALSRDIESGEIGRRIESWKIRARAAEASNARLREALTEILTALHQHVHPGRPARQGSIWQDDFDRYSTLLAASLPPGSPTESKT
jgi:chromosome segregation ATPase